MDEKGKEKTNVMSTNEKVKQKVKVMLTNENEKKESESDVYR